MKHLTLFFLIIAFVSIYADAQLVLDGPHMEYYSDISTEYAFPKKWLKEWDKAYKKLDEALLNNLSYAYFVSIYNTSFFSKDYLNKLGEEDRKKVEEEKKYSMAVALKNFEIAARMGDKLAEYNVGLFYYWGLHDEVNYDKAVEYFMKSAQKGWFMAQFYLAYCYQYGKGVKQNTKMAIYWYERSNQMTRNKLSQEALGFIYMDKGDFQDYNMAIYWFKEAVKSGSKHDVYEIIGLCYEGLEEYSNALDYYLKAAEGGLEVSQYKIGSFYYKGLGTDKNYNLAVSWFEKAASHNKSWRPIYYLGECYFNGNGVVQDYSKALDLFEKAASKDDSYAQLLFGIICISNQYKLYDKSEQYLLQAAGKGQVSAIYLLGQEYYYGKHYERDYVKAIDYLTKCVSFPNLSNPVKGNAFHLLAACYRFGRGVEKNIELANQYEQEASKYGDEDAQKVMEWIHSTIDTESM